MIVFLQVISIIALTAFIVVPVIINHAREEKSRWHPDIPTKKVKPIYTIIGVLLSAIIFVVACSIEIIPTGYTGVRTTFGQINETTVQNGFNWKIPFIQNIEKVNNKQQDLVFNDRIWSETSERTTIYYEKVTVTYQINPQKSAWIFTNVSNYKASLVNESIVASAVKAGSKTLSDTDATNRAIIEPLILTNLQESLDEKYGTDVVIINKVIVGNADFEDSYNQAIAAKQQAAIDAQRQEIENQKAVKKAEADAAVKKTTAEADAQAKLIAAEAEAKANELLEKSLTEQILREEWIQKWNGALPQYMSGSDGENIMFSIGTATTPVEP